MYWAINEKNNDSKRCEPGMGSFFPQNMNLIEPLVLEENLDNGEWREAIS